MSVYELIYYIIPINKLLYKSSTIIMCLSLLDMTRFDFDCMKKLWSRIFISAVFYAINLMCNNFAAKQKFVPNHCENYILGYTLR